MREDNPNTSVQEMHGNKKRIIRIAVCCLVIALVFTATFFLVRETPRYSLYWFKRAILQRDAESALKYVDLDSIIDNMAAQMSDGKSVEQGTSSGQSGKTSKNIGKDIVLQNLPAIKSQLREQLKSAIMSYNDQAVLEKLSRANVFGLRIEKKADMATVKVMGQDKIAFTMKKSSEGYWKIVSVNLKELM